MKYSATRIGRQLRLLTDVRFRVSTNFDSLANLSITFHTGCQTKENTGQPTFFGPFCCRITRVSPTVCKTKIRIIAKNL